MAGHYYNGRELELLIPASSLEVLKIAVIFGADAVYIGGEAFGLRAKAKNFSKEDMVEGIKFAHERDVKAFLLHRIVNSLFLLGILLVLRKDHTPVHIEVSALFLSLPPLQPTHQM